MDIDGSLERIGTNPKRLLDRGALGNLYGGEHPYEFTTDCAELAQGNARRSDARPDRIV